MSLIGSLIGLPVVGPVRAGWWLLEQIVATAEAEAYGEERLVAALQALHADLDAGRITVEEHATAEAEVIQRLRDARRRRQIAAAP